MVRRPRTSCDDVMNHQRTDCDVCPAERRRAVDHQWEAGVPARCQPLHQGALTPPTPSPTIRDPCLPPGGLATTLDFLHFLTDVGRFGATNAEPAGITTPFPWASECLSRAGRKPRPSGATTPGRGSRDTASLFDGLVRSRHLSGGLPRRIDRGKRHRGRHGGRRRCRSRQG